MGHVTAIEVYNCLKEYYNTETELLSILFAGEFTYVGAKNRDVLVYLGDEVKKGRIFDSKTGNFKSKWRQGVEHCPGRFQENVVEVVKKVDHTRFSHLKNRLNQYIEELNLGRYIPQGTPSKETCVNLLFVLFMYAIGGPVDFVVGKKAEGTVDNETEYGANTAKIVSFVVPPVSKDNYVSRPDIERDISLSLHTNKITVICGLSGLGKSELARKVATDETGFSTIIRLELGNDGSGDFDRLLETYVTVVDVPKDKTRLQCIKSILEKADSDTLIIVDNLNDISNSAFLLSLVTSTGNSRILITSQIQKVKLVAFFQKRQVSGAVVNLEAEAYQEEGFAPIVFCSYADLEYNSLTDSQQSAVIGICKLVMNHTMIVAALGSRLKEYSDKIGNILADMQSSVLVCLKKSLPVDIPKDLEDDEYLTPYEILKKLFGNLLSRPFKEIERQILGAIILLPSRYHEREVLEELVGDLKTANCSEAMGAVNKLLSCGILQLNANRMLELHPLYVQLFSDPQNVFFDEARTQKCGPVAELSADFAFHLLSNEFVSDIDFNDFYRLENGYFADDIRSHTQRLIENGYLSTLIISNRDWFSEISNTENYSWLYFWNDQYPWLFDCSKLLIAISQNHGIKDHVYEPEEVPLFFPTADEAWEKEMELERMASQKSAHKSWPLSKTTISKRHRYYEAVAYGRYGRAIFAHDIETKKDWCVVNRSEQRLPANRYFLANKSTNIQAGELNGADVTGFYNGSKTLDLFLSETVECGDSIVFMPINYSWPSCKSAHRTIPLVSICAETLVSPENVSIVSLPDGLKSIGSSVFEGAKNLSHIIIPDTVNYIGVVAFRGNPKLQKVELPMGIRLSFGLCRGYEHYYQTGTLGFDIGVDKEGHLQLVWDLLTDSYIKSSSWEEIDFPFDDNCEITIRNNNWGEDVDIIELPPRLGCD